MKKYICIIILLLTHNLSGSFLNTDETASCFGLGSGGAGYLNGAASAPVNPAGSFMTRDFDIVLSQYFGPESINCNYFALNKGLKSLGTVGVFYKMLYPGDVIKQVDDDGDLTGKEIDFNDSLIGFNYSRNIISILKGTFYAGFNVKYIKQELWTYSSSGMAGDIGVLYSSDFIRDLKLGLSFLNTGKTSDDFLEARYQYPQVLRLGISFSDNIFVNRWQEKRRLFFILDLIHIDKDQIDYLCLGSEYFLGRYVILRFGYKVRLGIGTQDVDLFRNLRAGLGINFKFIRFDYSLTMKSSPANQMLNYFTLGFRF